ncbi:MAG: GGDEF domain-containing protein [Sedimentisphaerales bacterium]
MSKSQIDKSSCFPLSLYKNLLGFTIYNKVALRHEGFGHSLSMIYIDVDAFKTINDLYGHHAGDQVLQAVVNRSHLHMRHIDIISRIGGDEFVILLPEATLATAQGIAERIHQAVIEKPVPVLWKQLKITTTLGITEARTDTTHLEALLANADKALYKAKHSGGNQVAAL